MGYRAENGTVIALPGQTLHQEERGIFVTPQSAVLSAGPSVTPGNSYLYKARFAQFGRG